MNYTKNYHLPQWAEEDRIQMEDFNQMCADIDAGLLANKEAAATAQATADAAYSPSQKPYAVGSYTGTGAAVSVELGFRPSFLIISGSQTVAASGIDNLGAFDLITAGNTCADWVTFTDTGFTLTEFASAYYPKLLVSGRNYDYIAFR